MLPLFRTICSGTAAHGARRSGMLAIFARGVQTDLPTALAFASRYGMLEEMLRKGSGEWGRAIPHANLRRASAGLAAAASIVVFAGVLIPALVHPARVPPMDDTYIHLTYSRNLLQSGRFMEYDVGVPSSGTTSPLWTALAIVPQLFEKTSPEALLMALSGLLAALAVFFAAGRRWAAPLILTGPFIFHAASGMETSLAVLLVVLMMRTMEGDSGRGPTLAILLAAAVLTRPELLVLALPVFLHLRRGAREAGASRTLPFLLPAALVTVLWAVWNLHATGSPMPAAFHAKVGEGVQADPAGLLKGLLLGSPGLLLALPFTMRTQRNRMSARSLIPPLLLAAALVTQPNGYFQMRYYAPFLAALAMSVPSGDAPPGDRRWWLAAPLLCLLLSLPGIVILSGRRVEASVDVDYIDRSPALLLDAIAPDSALIAAADAGAAGWFATGPDRPGRHLMDLDALVTPELAFVSRGERWSRILSEADYILAFPEQYSSLLESAPEALALLASYHSPCHVICGEDEVQLYRVKRD